MTEGMIIGLLLAAVVYLALRLEHVKRGAHDSIMAAYEAVAGLSDVAEAAHKIAEFEFRTAHSMTSRSAGGVRPWFEERNPTAAAAKLRGYEVWRNERIAPIQAQLRQGYKKYETWTRELVEIVEGIRR